MTQLSLLPEIAALGQLDALTLTAFAALTLAMIALWAPRVVRAPYASRWWPAPCAVALAAAAAAGLVDVRGLLVLLAFAASCYAAREARHRAVAIAAHAVMFAGCAGLLLHVLPGFDNPRVLDMVVLSPGSAPYTKYLSFDKGAAGLFLLGLYAPARAAQDEGFTRPLRVLWRFAAMAAVVMALSLAFGFVRWDPKLPPWWPMWIWSMVFLTALPEEALFRGVVQSAVARALAARSAHAPILAAIVVGGLFGLAHAGGGVTYVVLASIAGIGYGWIYASTRSIAAAIAAHSGLNFIHFAFFSYPSLAPPLVR